MALGIPGSYEGYNFSVGQATGVMAAGLAANSPIFQFRWAPGTGGPNCRIQSVWMSAAVDATGFTVGAALYQMFVSRGFTASGGGGTLTTVTSQGSLRTAQKQSRGAIVNVATTATLTAGTKVNDTMPCGTLLGSAGGAGVAIVTNIAIYSGLIGSYALPLVLANNEGFEIQASVPATGTWKAGIIVLWSEVDN